MKETFIPAVGLLTVFVLLLGEAHSAAADQKEVRKVAAKEKTLIYHSCQGEGCGCAKSPVVQADTVLYADMTLSSKKVGVLKKGQEGSVWESDTIVKKPGRGKVTKVENQDLGLSVGDKIELVLYKGEGSWLIRYKGKEIEVIESEDASWTTIERSSTETWYKLRAANIQGYSQDFPFEGCLE